MKKNKSLHAQLKVGVQHEQDPRLRKNGWKSESKDSKMAEIIRQ